MEIDITNKSNNGRTVTAGIYYEVSLTLTLNIMESSELK